ncbi:hypothetical protein EJC51_46220 [Streptomyces aquilus]|uniref:Uncharacterized protein n=1 Tax=Streptomyces aquilus TaxID=2548456 RepID=A0A3Q9C3U0_9ACTN|nr:hypothetical protein [Streptomyces aquilus]AZP22797.1 hypothetical protein EJC51_46220 [Streptomyces aquilus]
MADDDLVPRWASLGPHGMRAAAEATQFVAAPLLAGAAIATIGVAGADGPQFRWPGPAMLALTTAAVFLLAGIQLALRARRYLYSRADTQEWEGELEEGETPQRVYQQSSDMQVWRHWYATSARAYEIGVSLLGLGILGLLAPPDHASMGHAICRWTAVGVVGLAVVMQAVSAVRFNRMDRRRSPLRR